MSESEGLSEVVGALATASERVNRGSGSPWITTVEEALAGVDADEAAWKPGPDERSIWEITVHVYEWTQWAIHFLRGQDTEPIDWPPVPDTSEAAWQQTRNNVAGLLSAFDLVIATLPADSLLEKPTPAVTHTNGITGILSILIHNAYHAGQIVKLRERHREEAARQLRRAASPAALTSGRTRLSPGG